jgi:hypothetical protein
MIATNRIYPSGVAAIFDGTIDMIADDLALQVVDDTFEFDAAHNTLDDVPSGQRHGNITDIAGTRSITAGALVTDTPTTTLLGVGAGPELAGVLLVGPGATAADRALIGVWTRRSDRTPIVVVADGGSVEVEFVDGHILSIGGG